MWRILAGLILLGGTAAAQPADCPPAPGATGSLPLAIDLSGRPGLPAGLCGQALVTVPLSPTGDCGSAPNAPADVLRGEPGDVLGGPPSNDLLRGPGSGEPSRTRR